MNALPPDDKTPWCPTFREESRTFLLFLVATFAVYFYTAPFSFLYEDDYFTVGLPATQSLSWIWDQICFVWRTWPQGRPAMFTTLALEGGLISATGSVLAGYLPSFLIVSANGYLLYRLLRIKLPSAAAFAGAAFSLLSCADPHKILLTHAPLQFAITLNLLGVILYLNNRPVLAYLVAGSSLFFYEISFAIFVSAELFRQLHGKLAPKRLLLAWSAWVGVAVVVFVARLLSGESRVVEATANLSELCRRILTNLIWGPLYGWENSYVHPLVLAFKHPNFWLLFVSLLIVASLGLAGIALLRQSPRAARPDQAINPVVALAILGLLVFGPHALQLKRTVFQGFMRPVSGYHLGAGVALGFAAALLLTKCHGRLRATRIAIAVLLVLGWASAYQNQLIQHDYARSARYQAHFWAETRRLALDARPGDVILVPRKQLLETEYLLSNSWGVVYGWTVLFEQTGHLKDWFNIADERPVAVFLVPEDWEKQIKLEADVYTLTTDDYTPPGFQAGKIPLVDGHVIVLEATWAEPFQRRLEPIVAGDHRIPLKKAPDTGQAGLKYTVVGKYLFENFVN